MFFEAILLDCIGRINENRSIAGIYHMITGKKSIQSVQDARIFQLETYYGICPSLSKSYYNSFIDQLMKSGYLISDSDGFCRLTEDGRSYLTKLSLRYPISYFNGLRYTGKDSLFQERFYLVFQLISNLQMNERSFIPIVDNPVVTDWIKKVFLKQIKQEVNPAVALHGELSQLLKQFPNLEAELFVNRLTGYRHYGMSLNQLAEKHGLELLDVYFYLTGITHRFLTLIQHDQASYPLLYLLTVGNYENKFITKTANETYHLLKHNLTPAIIAQKRNLKLNTIYDHIVEIALYDDEFQIDSYVSRESKETIVDVIRTYKTYKLKTIKSNCPPSIDYFQIRLVIAKLNDYLLEDEIYV